MRLRKGLHRPPPLVKPHHCEDDNTFSSFDRPSPGKRHLPLLTRRRPDSFRSRLDYDEFTGRKSGLWKGESLEEYSESWRGGSQERRHRHNSRATPFDPAGLYSPTNDDWCDIRKDTHRTDSSYLGGYDFRDDVESIDTYEGKQRRQRRLAQAFQEECSASSRSPSGSAPPITVEYPDNIFIGGSQRSKNNSYGRDGSTFTSTIATNDDESLSQNQSMTTKTNYFGLNPQLLHAKSVPELPPGYLQRHDGVVISLGSSIASSIKVNERYADIDEQPEEAAQGVVDELRALGYKIDDNNGILGSNSDSGIFSKYGGKQSSTPSIEATTIRSHASVAHSILSQEKITTHDDATTLGMQYPPAMPTHSSESVGRDFIHRIKIRSNSNELQSNGSGRSSARVKAAIDARSYGSKKSKTMLVSDTQGMDSRNSNFGVQELNTKSLNDARSTGSRKPGAYNLASLGSKRSYSQKDERQSPAAHQVAKSASEVRTLTLDNGDSESDTRDSTIMADGSTLTSRTDDPALNPQRLSIIFDLPTTPLATSSHTGSFTRLNIFGAYPEVTSDGDRVPELVTRVDGLTTVMSDLSHQRSTGGSTLSSLTFNHNPPAQPQLATFCEKVLYSCRISAFPSTRVG